MCAICRARAPKRELVRIVWDGAAVSIDAGGKAQGRGAYVGPWRSCWSDPGLVPKLERALKATFGAPDLARLQAHALQVGRLDAQQMEDEGAVCPRRAALTTKA